MISYDSYSHINVVLSFMEAVMEYGLRQKRRRKKQKKKVSSVKLGRNKDEGILSEEHKVPNLERKSDETEEVNIEEKEASNVKSGETEELDLETTHPFFDDTADQDAAVTPNLERKSDNIG
ncbi:hypothetical protein Tco_1309189 [Tanacetum coccineum]